MTVLRGNVSPGWYDVYAFDAPHGQRVTVSALRSDRPVQLTLGGEHNFSMPIALGKPGALPADGRFTVLVESDDENVRYTFTLSFAGP